jgi:GNAT superfamily N-acetyltransferase
MPVRHAILDDIPAIIALQQRIYREHVAWNPRRWTIREAPPDVVYEQWLRELLTDGDPRGAVFVATHDAQVVGYLLAEVKAEASREWSSACVYAQDIYVHEDARRQGHARALMNELTAWTKQTRPDLPVRLLTAGPNESGRAFFASMGFVVCAVEMIDG